MITRKQIKQLTRPWIRFIKFRILHVDDSPRNLAMAIAIGFFFAWLPAFGIQMIAALAVAFFIRANKFLAVSFVWVSNVFTFGIIYLPNYLLGNWILKMIGIDHSGSRAEMIRLLKKISSASSLVDMWDTSFWKQAWHLLLNIGTPLWIGSFIIAPLVAAAAYICSYKIIVWYRRKNPRRRYKKHMTF